LELFLIKQKKREKKKGFSSIEYFFIKATEERGEEPACRQAHKLLKKIVLSFVKVSKACPAIGHPRPARGQKEKPHPGLGHSRQG